MGLLSASLSERGPVRVLNADATVCDDKLGFYAVADGVGSTLNSARASAFAVAEAHAQCQILFRKARAPIDLGELVREVGRRFQAEFADATPTPSTTLTVAQVCEQSVHYVSVGDSPAFLLDRSGIRLLTKAHTVVDRHRVFADYGEIKSLSGSNLLFNSLGPNPPNPVVYPPGVTAGPSRLVLCTDGFMEIFTQAALAQYSGQAASPDALVRLAREAAAAQRPPDNYSVIVVDLPNPEIDA